MNMPLYYICEQCEEKFPSKDYSHETGLCKDCFNAKKDAVAKLQCSDGLSCAWIDVKERLPEEGQIALWWNEDIRMIEFGSAGSFNGENVPYWLPLPDPPAR